MTVMLKDAPGGPELIGSLTEAIKALSLLYSGTPDDKASEHLQSYVSRIEPELTEAVGAGPANVILDAFTSAVMTEKHRLEAAGASRA